MKVLALLGSPRRNGNTAVLMNKYLEGIEAATNNLVTSLVHLDAENIKGCKSCNACQMNKTQYCVIKDDMIELYKEIESANVIIFATPIYFFSVSAQMKLFIDWLYALLSKLENKKIVLLSTYGANTEADAGVKNVIDMFEKTSQFTNLDFVHSLNVGTGQQGVSTNPTALNQAYSLGLMIH